MACKKGDTAFLKLMIETCINSNDVQKKLNKYLDITLRYNHIEIANYLAQKINEKKSSISPSYNPIETVQKINEYSYENPNKNANYSNSSSSQVETYIVNQNKILPNFILKQAFEGFALKTATEDCDCVICLESLRDNTKNTMLRTCGHVFHKTCINEHIKHKKMCPMCKAKCNLNDIFSNN